MSQLFSLEGQVVHVSGGSRGIGRKIAEALSEAGAKVVVSSRTETDLKPTGLCYQVCDIMDAGQVERCVNAIVAQFGRLDVLFNAAGINFRHAAETFPVDKLDDILTVNVRGNYLMARACGRVMVERKKGKIINIASLHTMQSLAGVSVYGMSKGAIGSMTRALAVEWAPHNVQVNAIAPGFIITDLNRKLWDYRCAPGWKTARLSTVWVSPRTWSARRSSWRVQPPISLPARCFLSMAGSTRIHLAPRRTSLNRRDTLDIRRGKAAVPISLRTSTCRSLRVIDPVLLSRAQRVVTPAGPMPGPERGTRSDLCPADPRSSYAHFELRGCIAPRHLIRRRSGTSSLVTPAIGLRSTSAFAPPRCARSFHSFYLARSLRDLALEFPGGCKIANPPRLLSPRRKRLHAGWRLRILRKFGPVHCRDNIGYFC